MGALTAQDLAFLVENAFRIEAGRRIVVQALRQET